MLSNIQDRDKLMKKIMKYAFFFSNLAIRYNENGTLFSNNDYDMDNILKFTHVSIYLVVLISYTFTLQKIII